MEAPLEIRYAGVVIGRAQEVRSTEGDAQSFFLPVRDPMPVGTVLRLRSGDQETPVRVVRAVETTDATACGMQVKTLGDAEEVALEFIPPPAVAVAKLKPATPTPVVEVDVSKMSEEGPPTPASPPAPIAAAPAAEAAPAVNAAAPAPAEPASTPIEVAEPAPLAPASAPIEVAAVPDAVPVAVGSSMTGALRNATESVPISEPAIEAATVASVKAGEPASPQATLTSAASLTQEYGSVMESASEASDGSPAVSPAKGEDLPPARPIAGPSGRRKTKRRK